MAAAAQLHAASTLHHAIIDIRAYLLQQLYENLKYFWKYANLFCTICKIKMARIKLITTVKQIENADYRVIQRICNAEVQGEDVNL